MSENLITYPYYHTTHTTSGITFTDNGDGTITIDGTFVGSEPPSFWLNNSIPVSMDKNYLITAEYISGKILSGNVKLTVWGQTVPALERHIVDKYLERDTVAVYIDIYDTDTVCDHLIIRPIFQEITTSDRLTTIAENVPKVYHSGQLSVLENSEALHGRESGTAIAVNDVSPIEHGLGVKIRSKNFWFGDSSFTLTQENDYYAAREFYLQDNPEIVSLFNDDKHRGVPITYSAKFDNRTDFITYGLTLYAQGYEQNISHGYIPIDGSYTFAIPVDFPRIAKVEILVRSDSVASNNKTVTLYDIQFELGETATPYTPYITDFTDVEVTRCGKNLIPYPYSNTSWTDNGITYTANDDGSITANGTFENIEISSFATVSWLTLPLNATYTISGAPVLSGLSTQVRYCDLSDGHALDNASSQNGDSTTFVASTSGVEAGIQISIKSTGTVSSVNNLVFKPQIELGSVATEYEPYVESVSYTPLEDGSVEGVTSLYPVTTLLTDTEGVIIDCEYYKDIDLAFENLTSEIALSGGE